jgi:hypothetical protein
MEESKQVENTSEWAEKIQAWLETNQFNVSGLHEVMNFLKTADELSPELKNTLVHYLRSIRWENFAAYMIEHIPACKSPEVRALLLRSCWENGSDFSPHLQSLVHTLLFGSFDESLEASSVIESIEPQLLAEEEIEAAINLILENLSKLDEQRREFASLMIEILQP